MDFQNANVQGDNFLLKRGLLSAFLSLSLFLVYHATSTTDDIKAEGGRQFLNGLTMN